MFVLLLEAATKTLLVIPDAAKRRSGLRAKICIRHSGAARASGRNPEPSDFASHEKVAGFRIAAARRPQ
jgi:hypothetical protein